MTEIEFKDILNTTGGIKKKVREWRNQDEVRKFMLSQEYITEEEHFNWLDNLQKDKSKKFWVVFVEKTPIGTVNLNKINKETLTSYWGFYIGEQSYRNKGYGKKILFKLLKIFFEDMGFQTLYTEVLSKNEKALGIYKKFGFMEKEEINNNCKENFEKIKLEFTRNNWEDKKRFIKFDGFRCDN